MQKGIGDIGGCALKRTQRGNLMMPRVRRSIRSPIMGARELIDYG